MSRGACEIRGVQSKSKYLSMVKQQLLMFNHSLVCLIRSFSPLNQSELAVYVVLIILYIFILFCFALKIHLRKLGDDR
jgi:hypothetical protein